MQPVLLPTGRERACMLGGGLQPPNRAARCWGSSTPSHGTLARLAGGSGGGGEEKPPRLKVNVETKQSRDGNASAAAPMQTAPALWQPSPDKGASGSVPTLPSFSLRRCFPPSLASSPQGEPRASVPLRQCPCPRLHTCVQSSTHVPAARPGLGFAPASLLGMRRSQPWGEPRPGVKPSGGVQRQRCSAASPRSPLPCIPPPRSRCHGYGHASLGEMHLPLQPAEPWGWGGHRRSVSPPSVGPTPPAPYPPGPHRTYNGLPSPPGTFAESGVWVVGGAGPLCSGMGETPPRSP